MKKRRCLILLLTCLMLFTSIMSIPANAAEVDQTPVWNSGALPATEEQLAYWEPIAQAKRNARNAARSSTYATEANYDWVYPTRGIYYFGQERCYTCGVACARMLIYNIDYTYYSEDEAMTLCHTTTSGTYLSDMANFVNSHAITYDYYYAISGTTTISTVCEDLYGCIADSGYPAILGIDTLRPSYPYNPGGEFGTTKHFVVVYAAKCDANGNYTFKIADPWAGYMQDYANRFYDLTQEQLSEAYSGLLGYMF